METLKVPVRCGDRVLLVSQKKASEIRQAIALRQERDRRISQELRQERLLPRDHRNQTSGWSGLSHCKDIPVVNRSERELWVESKKASIESRWQEHLKREWVA
jgi:hypothetical protein